jgi:hypothetical protein
VDTPNARRRHRLLTVACLAALAGCRDGGSDANPVKLPTAVPVAPRTTVSGDTGERPVYDPDRPPVLRFVSQPPQAFDVRLEGAPAATVAVSGAEQRGDVWLVRLEWPARGPEPGDGAVVLPDGQRFEVRWGTSPETAAPEVRRLRLAGELDEAARALTARWGEMDAAARLRAAPERALLAEARGDWKAAEEAWRAAATLAAAASAPGDEARRMLRASDAARASGRFGAAARWAAQAESLAGRVGDVALGPLALWRRGGLLAKVGQPRTGMRLVAEAARAAWEAGEDAEAAAAVGLLARITWRFGGGPVAAAALAEVEPIVGGDPALRRTWAMSRSAVVLRAQASGRPVPVPGGDWRAIVDTWLDAALDDARSADDARAVVRINLLRAWSALLAGDGRVARQWLEKVGAPEQGGAEAELHAVFLDATLRLESGDATGAAHGFRRAAEAARDLAGGVPSDAEWRAALGEGRAHRAGDRIEQAQAAEARAEAIWAATVAQPRLIGRYGPALGGADRIPAVRIADRLAAEDPGGAYDALERAARARWRGWRAEALVGALDARAIGAWARVVEPWGEARAAYEMSRDDGAGLMGAERAAWLHAQSERRPQVVQAFVAIVKALGMPAPRDVSVRGSLAADEALWAFARLADGWHGLVVARDGVSAFGPLADTPDALVPLLSALSGRRRLYIVDGGFAPAWEVPAVEVSGVRIGERLEVAYLPEPTAFIPNTGRGMRGALVIVPDAAGRAVADAVARAHGATPLDLVVGRAASRDEVLKRLSAPEWLHLQGRCTLWGGSPADVGLALVDGGLPASRIMATAPSIALVTASGCGEGTGPPGVSLGAALVAAGAVSAVTPVRPVEPAAAQRFLEAFFAAGGRARPGAAYKKVMTEMRASGDHGAAAWRIYGRL